MLATMMKPTGLAMIALAALLLDQATKAMALAALSAGQPVPVLPGFALTLGFNSGAGFGFLSGLMAGRPLAMVALTGLLTAVFAWLAWRSTRPTEAAGFALIVGRSLGNITDRLRQGAVTDFLDVFWQDWHWPTFNMADVAITCGAALVIMASLPAFKTGRDHA
jgi:signal peptidase II